MSGLATTDDFPAGDDQGDRLVRTALYILTAYLAVMLVPLLAWTARSGDWRPAAAHVAALALAVAAARNQSIALRPLRDWTPLALGPFLYVELRWVIAGAGRAHADALVAGWEGLLFNGDPSRSLAVRFPWLALSEVLHLCYISYYALVYVPPALLWFRAQRREFAETVLALVIVYATCFTVYVFFPVDGPRFMYGPSLAPDGPIRALVVRLLESGSSRGTAFPSSHVAASVVAAVCALRTQPRVGRVVAALAVGLAVGAVYGGYHYAVDIVAGLLTAALAIAISDALARPILSS